MPKVTYEQARADHEYLWSIAPAYDMTGGYEDQNDLARMLKSPTKGTARDCYVDQIVYWFEKGPADVNGSMCENADQRRREVTRLMKEDDRVDEIYLRYC